jgi:acyl-CoA synthetase (AMP-forming)/AMP-acid ligase II
MAGAPQPQLTVPDDALPPSAGDPAPRPGSAEGDAVEAFFIDGLDPASREFNISQLISVWAHRQGDTVAVATAKGRDTVGQPLFHRLTYKKLDRRVDAIAHVFAQQGLKAGDRVGMFVPDAKDFVALAFALMRMGAVPVLIDPGMGVKNLTACAKEQSLKGFVGVPKAHILRKVFGSAFAGVTVAVRTGPGWFPGVPHLDDLIDHLPPDVRTEPYPPAALEPGAPATIVYTSGSTGIPKGVIYTHRMMAGQVAGVRHVGGFTEGETHVACFPGFGLYAVGIGMTTVFPAMDFTKPAQADPERIIEAIDFFEARSAFGSPALWETFSRYVEQHHTELPRIRAIFASGAAVQPALLKRLLPAIPHGDMLTPYGATESLPVATIGGREILARTAAKTAEGAGTCVGRVAPNTEVRILPITDEPIASWSETTALAAGQIGEIAVRGPQVTEVYDQRPSHTAKAKIKDDDGNVWHRMGDCGYLDEDGCLWFVGRKSHRVETADGLLFSVPCEAVFETDDRVFRAALTWVGERPRQTPVMCIELKPGVETTPSLLGELKALGQAAPTTQQIAHLFVHPGFPVDRRHNAKIEREKLAVWASARVKG